MTDAERISPMLAVASGSAGDVVFSRNQHGPYTRPRTPPVQPDTAQQINARNAFATANQLWPTLSPARRAGWTKYAQATGWWKNPVPCGPLQGNVAFARCQVPRIINGQATVLDPPTIFALPEYTLPRIVVSASAPSLQVSFYLAPEPWVHTNGCFLTIASQAPVAGTVNFYAGPYQRLAIITGSSGSPPTNPVQSSWFSPALAGQKVPFELRLCLADGRASRPRRLLITAT